MNSQFRNSNFGFILYAAIVTIMVIATAFVVWYMTIGYRVGTFGPDTRLGSVYIGGLTEDEVVPLMDERITDWYNDETIVFEITYQDYVFELDRDLLLFDLDLSTFDLQDGVTNELLAFYQPEDLQAIRADINNLPYLQNILDNLDINQLINDLLDDAALMKSYSSKSIEHYILDPQAEISLIQSSEFHIPEGVNIDEIIAELETRFPDGHIPIASKQLFDIFPLLGDLMNDQELTMLSSAILESILATNFIVNEVHFDPNINFTLYTIETYPYFGHNTVLNRVVNEGFNFYNPNVFDYYFVVEKTDDDDPNGVLNLYGVPFEYDIDITIEKTEVPYIIQTTDDLDLLQFGYNGVIVEVHRTITDINGIVVSDQIILTEFYPPVKQIIFEP